MKIQEESIDNTKYVIRLYPHSLNLFFKFRKIFIGQNGQIIAQHFTAISQEFEPLSLEKLPSNIQLNITKAHSSPPILSEVQVFKKIFKS